MGVRAYVNDGLGIDEFFDIALEIIRNEIIRTLSYLGEQAVNQARLPHALDWNDITGNLRSSIGYGVYEHGKQQILSAFEMVRQGREGQEKGLKLVEELAKKYSDTYALVVVAGMDYASMVEARDNRDVLASATLSAMAKMDDYMNKAIEKAINQINKL